MAKPYLGDPKQTMEILQKYQFTIQKRFGQNFLTDAHILQKIVEKAKIQKQDIVLEIGPGIGNLTQYLADAADRVIAIEIDRMLLPILEETLSEFQNVTIINQDVLKVDLTSFLWECGIHKPVKVVANLPYYAATPILISLLENQVPIESITVMIQKEVADRILAKPGNKKYGALSLIVRFYTKPEILMQVSSNCFIPKPQVDSSVIRLIKYQKPSVKVKNKTFLFQLIRAAFHQRRKTLVNSMINFPDFSFTRGEIEEAMLDCGLSEMVRGEKLTLEEFANLSNKLCL